MEAWKLVLAGGGLALGGITIGAWLFGAGPAVAQDAGFHECIVARQESLDTDGSGQVARPDIGHTILVPAGFVPIGGGGFLAPGNGTSTVVLCRR